MENLAVNSSYASRITSLNPPKNISLRLVPPSRPTFGADIEKPLAEKDLENFSVSNMEVGTMGYVAPWAIYQTFQGLFLQADFPVFRKPDARVNIKIERISVYKCGFRIYNPPQNMLPEKPKDGDLQCQIAAP